MKYEGNAVPVFTSYFIFPCSSFLFHNLQQLHIKYQSRSWRYSSPIDIAITQVRRYEQAPFAADRHQLQRFGPTAYHLSYIECDRLIVGVRAFKDVSIDKRTGIVAFNII